MSDTYEWLAAQFPASAHKTKSMGGRDLLYVDGEMVVSRLNEVLGFDGWSFEVGQVNVLEDEVWVTGKLTVYSGERTVVREQAGGQIINRTRGIPARPAVPAEGDRPEQPAVPAQKGQIVELSNDIKGAITDCLKKCATLVGVGLYLYDPAERREVEAEMKAERRGGSKPDAIKPDEKTEAAAVLTGAPETVQQRWARLVAEAERLQYPKLAQVRAIAANSVSTKQLAVYADQLEGRLSEARGAA